MKTKLTFLIVFFSLAMHASGQTVYNLHPYTRDNRIDLTIANEAQTTPAEQVEVKATQYPQEITFNNVIQTIESVPPQGITTVSFTFDVGRPSTIGKSSIDTLKFLVSLPSPKRSFSSAQAGDASGTAWEKSILVRYALPTMFALEQNFPNPFNPTTTINYQLPEASHVTIRVYDLLGRTLRTLVDEPKEAGYYQIDLNLSAVASGVYFYRMTAGKYTSVKKLLLTK